MFQFVRFSSVITGCEASLRICSRLSDDVCGSLELRLVKDRFVECNVVLAGSEIEMILMVRVCFVRAGRETSWPDLGGF